MALNFDRINVIVTKREAIRLKARVARLWSVPSFNNPTQTNSIEMVLIDESGGKIQASVRRNLLHKFAGALEEGNVYKFAYFSVVENTGHYKATFHEFKLIFLYKTTVMKMECDSISKYGLTCMPFADVLQLDDDYDHLIDVMGLLTTVYPERKYEKEAKVTSMVVIELIDCSGKLECALFGDYVEELRKFLNAGDNIQVVVVVQLARVKTFRGKTVIQNSINATRLLFNPDIQQALIFRDRIAQHGSLDVEPLTLVLDNTKQALESEFMKIHPKKLISELERVKEAGFYVVLATIDDIVADGSWYYMACKCNRSVQLRDSLYFCETCRVPVFQVYTRYKVKVEVSDITGSVVFMLFDRDVRLLINKTCEELVCESMMNVGDKGYPNVFDSLIGRKMAFKVEKKADECKHFDFDTAYTVRKVCTDADIIAMFELPGADLSPTKAVFAPPFSTMGKDVVNLQDLESDVIVNNVSLCSDSVNYTPVKRKLDEALIGTHHGSSSSGSKTTKGVDVEEEVDPVSVLDYVKLGDH